MGEEVRKFIYELINAEDLDKDRELMRRRYLL